MTPGDPVEGVLAAMSLAAAEKGQGGVDVEEDRISQERARRIRWSAGK
jgi:hypothetical protein